MTLDDFWWIILALVVIVCVLLVLVRKHLQRVEQMQVDFRNIHLGMNFAPSPRQNGVPNAQGKESIEIVGDKGPLGTFAVAESFDLRYAPSRAGRGAYARHNDLYRPRALVPIRNTFDSRHGGYTTTTVMQITTSMTVTRNQSDANEPSSTRLVRAPIAMHLSSPRALSPPQPRNLYVSNSASSEAATRALGGAKSPLVGMGGTLALPQPVESEEFTEQSSLISQHGVAGPAVQEGLEGHTYVLKNPFVACIMNAFGVKGKGVPDIIGVDTVTWPKVKHTIEHVLGFKISKIMDPEKQNFCYTAWHIREAFRRYKEEIERVNEKGKKKSDDDKDEEKEAGKDETNDTGKGARDKKSETGKDNIDDAGKDDTDEKNEDNAEEKKDEEAEEKYDGFILIYDGHGKVDNGTDCICGADNETVLLEDLAYMLSEIEGDFSALKGMPRIFLLNMCKTLAEDTNLAVADMRPDEWADRRLLHSLKDEMRQVFQEAYGESMDDTVMKELKDGYAQAVEEREKIDKKTKRKIANERINLLYHLIKRGRLRWSVPYEQAGLQDNDDQTEVERNQLYYVFTAASRGMIGYGDCFAQAFEYVFQTHFFDRTADRKPEATADDFLHSISWSLLCDALGSATHFYSLEISKDDPSIIRLPLDVSYRLKSMALKIQRKPDAPIQDEINAHVAKAQRQGNRQSDTADSVNGHAETDQVTIDSMLDKQAQNADINQHPESDLMTTDSMLQEQKQNEQQPKDDAEALTMATNADSKGSAENENAAKKHESDVQQVQNDKEEKQPPMSHQNSDDSNLSNFTYKSDVHIADAEERMANPLVCVAIVGEYEGEFNVREDLDHQESYKQCCRLFFDRLHYDMLYKVTLTDPTGAPVSKTILLSCKTGKARPKHAIHSYRQHVQPHPFKSFWSKEDLQHFFEVEARRVLINVETAYDGVIVILSGRGLPNNHSLLTSAFYDSFGFKWRLDNIREVFKSNPDIIQYQHITKLLIYDMEWDYEELEDDFMKYRQQRKRQSKDYRKRCIQETWKYHDSDTRGYPTLPGLMNHDFGIFEYATNFEVGNARETLVAPNGTGRPTSKFIGFLERELEGQIDGKLPVKSVMQQLSTLLMKQSGYELKEGDDLQQLSEKIAQIVGEQSRGHAIWVHERPVAQN